MKLFIGLMTLAMSFATVASSGESKTFIYDGSRPSIEFILRGEKTHTEYRYETRPSTCYRQEVVGYRTVCNGGGYPGPGPRPYPGPRPGNCYQTPIYRSVAYSCPQTVQIPYEVKDYDVEARLILDVTKLSAAATPGEKFTATLNGDDLTVTAVGSKNFLIVQKKRDIRANMNGNVKLIDGLVAVELLEAAPILSALRLTNMQLENTSLNFNMGPIANSADFSFALHAVKNRRLGSDITLIDRELLATEIELASAAAGTLASINIDALNISMNDAKVTFTVNAQYKAQGPIMNASQFSGLLDVKKTLTVDNRN